MIVKKFKIEDNTKLWLPESYKNQIIDKMNADREVVLSPGQVWTPGQRLETRIFGKFIGAQDAPAQTPDVKPKTPETCGYHEWVDVILFRTTVTECKKCGKLREQSDT